MRFEPDDERAFFTRRDELGERFAEWLQTHGVPGDPNDAGLLMDWKWSYADGALDRWTVADVHAFLFEWCVRKLSASPADCAEIPLSVAAFVEFLAHTGLLRGGDPPARIRRHCEQNAAAFVREMGNPANFGMAKSMFAPAPAEDEDEPPALGPVRMPSEADRLASARSAPLLAGMRELARFCAAPGRALTLAGNLRIADARTLVELLDTGDPIPDGLRSSDDLPELAWTIATAIEAGVVRRQKGKLVAVARFARLGDIQAHGKLVEAGLVADGTAPGSYFPVLAPVFELLDECVCVALFRLLDGGGSGMTVDDLNEVMVDVITTEFPGLAEFVTDGMPQRFRYQLGHLARLGVVTTGDRITLTPAGVHVVAERARATGVEVLTALDPAAADARAMVDLIGVADEDGWDHDVAEWFAAQADPDRAAAELAAAVTEEDRATIVVLAGLEALATLAGDRAVELVRAHVGGPHDGLVLNWLISRNAIDPATVDPLRLLCSMIDLLAVALDRAGPAAAVSLFDGSPRDENLDLLDGIWRFDHPRLVDVLEALGKHYPDKAVAKAARKALVRHRSMPAEQRIRSRG